MPNLLVPLSPFVGNLLRVGQGLEDNSMALTMQGMYLYREMKAVIAPDPAVPPATVICSMCHPKTGCLGTDAVGDIAGKGGRCMRYPECRVGNAGEIKQHMRSTNLHCPHHEKHRCYFRGDEWDD